MGVGIITLAVIALVIAVPALYYAQSKRTLPGYKDGDGKQTGWGTFLAAAVLGGAAIYGLGAWMGINVFTSLSTITGFLRTFDDSLLNVGGYALILGTIGVVAVTAYNLLRYGKAVM